MNDILLYNFLLKKINKDCCKLISNYAYPSKGLLKCWLCIHKYKSSCKFIKKFNLIKKCNCHICDIFYYGHIYNNYYIDLCYKYMNGPNSLQKRHTFFTYLIHTKCLS